MDTVDIKTRKRMMSGIRSKNTKPEIIVRKALFANGFRYRKNVDKIFGKPDIVLKKYNAVIFIHGCFWHGHWGCKNFKIPSTNTEFWINKIDTNRKRDAEVLNYLHATGWRVCIIWECSVRGKKQVENIPNTINKIVNWLKSDSIWIEIKNEDI
jgi:DNA mismatch endonuclease (patch repair protein)